MLCLASSELDAQITIFSCSQAERGKRLFLYRLPAGGVEHYQALQPVQDMCGQIRSPLCMAEFVHRKEKLPNVHSYSVQLYDIAELHIRIRNICLYTCKS